MRSMMFLIVKWLVCYEWYSPVIHSFVWHTVQGYLLLYPTTLIEQTKFCSPKRGGFCKLLIEELRVTPLSGHLGIQKLTHALFQKGWWPKPRDIVTSFVYSYITFLQIKDSTAVPPGLLKSLPVPESCSSSWNIDFTTDLPLSHGYSTILNCVNWLTKYTILISSKMGD